MEHSNYTNDNIISEISDMIKAEIDDIQSTILNTPDNTTKKLTIEMFGYEKTWTKIGTLENCSLEKAEKFVEQIKKQYPIFKSDVLFRVVG